ncbi:MAG: hypothetical protein GF329_03460 [Candidatus Lokiarchaeota archaeon]|nr:hypothetical protein [Candidatus Lokiarchaeota archaeon]
MISFHKKIIDEEILTLAEVKKILDKRSDGDPEELSYLQKMTYNYVNDFSKLSLEDTLKFRDELMSEFDIPIEIATQMVNFRDLPEVIQELDIFFKKTSVRLSKEQKEKLLEVILKYKEKMEDFE